jgi:hypothetical protein
MEEKRKIGGMHQNDNPNNELDFLAEDNQWASIYKYNDYLQKKKDAIIEIKV